jgi:hypothetical protein
LRIMVGGPAWALDIGGAVQAEVLGLRLGDDGIELTGPQGRPQSNEELLNLQAGLCLDDPSGRTTNGTVPQIWNCLGNQAQNYAFGYCRDGPANLPELAGPADGSVAGRGSSSVPSGPQPAAR